MVNFNTKLLSKLEAMKVNKNEYLTILMALHNGLHESNPLITSAHINMLSMHKLIDYKFNEGIYVLKTPLYSRGIVVEPDFNWIVEYMDMFGKVNLERKGDKQQCINRAKKLMKDNPDITPEIILNATRFYIHRVLNPQYLKKSHKFLWNEENGYEILTYVEMSKNNNPNDGKIVELI